MNNLFKPATVGNVQLRNRFIRSGTWMRKATEDGDLTPELMAEYRKLAEGHIGMVIAGYARVNSIERANNQMIGMYDDKFIPQLQEFTKMFHDNGTAVGIQLAMGGTQVSKSCHINWDLMSPSPATVKHIDENNNEYTIEVEEMSHEQIKVVINDFVSAARRVKASNFDMVQLHAAHGYFLSQWMNPELNRREDEYGTNSSKFITELYQAVRAEVGADFPIGIKINSEEKVGDDSNHHAILEMCIKLDKLGIDLIEVSGNSPSRTKIKLENEGYFADFASKLTAKVNCPVMLTGGNKTLAKMTDIANESNIDFIGLSRPLLSEPDLIRKWEQDPSYKARCVSCNHCHRKTYLCVFDK